MKLIKVKLYNFRAFADEQVIEIDDLTTFIGNNSSGKTSALAALNLIFSQNSSERVLKRSDFHIPANINPENINKNELYIEAVFSFDEVLKDNCNYLPAIPIYFQNMVVDSPNGIPILRIRLSATWERSNNIDGSIDSKICFITCSEDEDLTEDNKRTANRKDLDNIRMIYVPATRDPSKQLKNVSGTMMHQILSSVKWSETTKKNIQKSIEELNNKFSLENGVTILAKSIREQWKNYDSDIRYSNAKLKFNSTNIESSIKNSEVYFSPTVTNKEYTIDEMGDGLRSLFYISMVNSILDVESEIEKEYKDNIDEDDRSFLIPPPLLTIVAIEEPENHISPQLLGKLIYNLKNISNKENAQVIITSHSPAIVKRIETENLRYFRLENKKLYSIVKKICLPNKEKLESKYKFIKEAVRAYPELYFAKIVILGEGDSEEIILPKYFDAYDERLDLSGISVVPLGGRYVNHFWRLLSDLGIPYITLLDLDRERKGGGWGRIKYALIELLKIKTPKKKLLKCKNGKILSIKAIKRFHKKSISKTDDMDYWLSRLEEYYVYFSSPLDIDFMMLECLGKRYQESLGKLQGPRLTIKNSNEKNTNININNIDKTIYKDEFERLVKNNVKRALKKKGGRGSTYTDTQKELMIWYNYFFLNRGKPTTHITVLSKMSSNDLQEKTPEVIKKIIKKTKELFSKQG